MLYLRRRRLYIYTLKPKEPFGRLTIGVKRGGGGAGHCNPPKVGVGNINPFDYNLANC